MEQNLQFKAEMGRVAGVPQRDIDRDYEDYIERKKKIKPPKHTKYPLLREAIKQSIKTKKEEFEDLERNIHDLEKQIQALKDSINIRVDRVREIKKSIMDLDEEFRVLCTSKRVLDKQFGFADGADIMNEDGEGSERIETSSI